MILYLHGFRSSPRSRKAEQIRAALVARGRAGDFVCPQLPASPRAAANVALAAASLEDPTRLALIGSSLGGYYATWVAEQLGCRAVLLNPAVAPARDLAPQLGRHPVFFSDQTIELTVDHLAELQAVDTVRITRPQRYLLVAATGDEVLDWTAMVTKYAGCRQRVIKGSDHALSDFDRYLDQVLDFCDGLD
jgi:predicted esterase YcpF (UPF0227 family)